MRRFPPHVLIHGCLVTEYLCKGGNQGCPKPHMFSDPLSSTVSHYEDGRRGSNEGSTDRDSLRSCTYCCRPASRVWAQSHGGPRARSPTQSGQECRVVIEQCLPDPHPHQAGQSVNNHTVSVCPEKHPNSKTQDTTFVALLRNRMQGKRGACLHNYPEIELSNYPACSCQDHFSQIHLDSLLQWVKFGGMALFLECTSPPTRKGYGREYSSKEQAGQSDLNSSPYMRCANWMQENQTTHQLMWASFGVGLCTGLHSLPELTQIYSSPLMQLWQTGVIHSGR